MHRADDAHMVDVMVTRHSVVVFDGRTYGEGETLGLPRDEVRSFEEQGIVTRASRRPPSLTRLPQHPGG